MAGFGAAYIKFNPIKEQPKKALPVYEDKGAVRLGLLAKADLSVTFASGKLFADNELAESLDEFSYGTLAVETDDMLDEVASVVYGCEVTDQKVHYKYGDTPPEGGLAYYKVLLRRGKRYYKGFFYPRAKAALGNDSAQTRGESLTFTTTNTSFTIFTCNSGDWRITETFETEDEVKAWVDEMVNDKSAGTDPAQPEGGTGESEPAKPQG